MTETKEHETGDGGTRWKCVCAYDGAPFAGWQSQAGGNSIQDVIEARLAQVFGTPRRIHGSGRTDAGVHARAQVRFTRTHAVDMFWECLLAPDALTEGPYD
jgi:tRNA pseudouridine(38-40) synthase